MTERYRGAATDADSERVGVLDVAPTVLVVLLMVGLGFQARAMRQMDSLLVETAQHRADLRRVDGLVGGALPGDQPRESNGVVWVVDTDDCIGCLADIGEWNALAADDGVYTRVVVVDRTPDEVELIRRTHRIEGEMHADAGGSLEPLLGQTLSSLKLLVAADGTIRWADPRTPASCRVSFETMVRDHHLPEAAMSH